MTSMLAITSTKRRTMLRAGRSIGDRRRQFQPLPGKGCYAALTRFGEDREGGVGRFFDDFKERTGWTARRALALLPIAYGLDRHADPCRERGLREAGPASHIARIAGLLGAGGVVRGAGDCARIAGNRALAAVRQHLDQASIRFQPHAQHCACSPALSKPAIIADSSWIQ